ncbi:MAG: prepilin peptidase [Lachnospiraceae bacterium]|nr:prepilin peptidase [Lachnospiraceae bacterium]
MAEYLAGLLLLGITAAEDIREKKISVRVVCVFACGAVLYHMLSGNNSFGEMAFGLFPGCLLLMLSALTGESIGYGDGILVLTLGLWTGGWFAFAVTVIGIMLSGIYGTFCLLKRKNDPIPFVPFLLLGMEVLLFYA